MKLAILLFLATVACVTSDHDHKPKLLEHIHFTVGGKGGHKGGHGDGHLGGGDHNPKLLEHFHLTTGGKGGHIGGHGGGHGGVHIGGGDHNNPIHREIRRIHVIPGGSKNPVEKIIRRFLIIPGGKIISGGSKGATGGGAKAGFKSIEVLFTKLGKAVETGDTATVIKIVEKLLIELEKLVRTLPAPFQKLVGSIITDISLILKQLKSGNGSLKTIFIEITKILKKILGGDAGGGGGGKGGSTGKGNVSKSSTVVIKIVLPLVTKLRQAVSSGNVAEVTKIINQIDVSLKGAKGLSPAQQELFDIISKLIAKISLLLKKGNTTGALNSLNKIENILVKIETGNVGTGGGKGKGTIGVPKSPNEIIISIKELPKLISTGQTSEAIALIEKLTPVLQAWAVKLPASLRVVILSAIDNFKELPAQLKSGKLESVIATISKIVNILTGVAGGSGAKGGNGGNGIDGLKEILVSIKQLPTLLSSGNTLEANKIIRQTTLKLQGVEAKLPPSLQKVVLSIIEKLKNLPVNSKGGNIKLVIATISQIVNTLQGVIGGSGAKGGKGGNGVNGLKQILVSIEQLPTLVSSGKTSEALQRVQQITLKIQALVGTLPASLQKIALSIIEKLKGLAAPLQSGNIKLVVATISQIVNTLRGAISGSGAKGGNGVNGLKEIILLIEKLQAVIPSGDNAQAFKLIQQITLKLNALVGTLPASLQPTVLEIIEDLKNKLAADLEDGNQKIALAILAQILQTLNQAVSGTSTVGVPKNLNDILTLVKKLKTQISSGKPTEALKIVEILLSTLKALAPKLSASLQPLITAVIENLEKLQVLLYGGQTDQALDVVEQILVTLNKILVGSGPSGSKSDIQAILALCANLKSAVASRNISEVAAIVEQLVAALKKLSATLPASLQKIVLILIQKVTQIPALLKAGKTADVNSIIEEIYIVIQRIQQYLGGGGGGAKGAKGSKGLTPQQILEIEEIFTKLVGPELAKTLTSLVVTVVNSLLGKVPPQEIQKIVEGLLVKLLKSHGLSAFLII